MHVRNYHISVRVVFLFVLGQAFTLHIVAGNLGPFPVVVGPLFTRIVQSGPQLSLEIAVAAFDRRGGVVSLRPFDFFIHFQASYIRTGLHSRSIQTILRAVTQFRAVFATQPLFDRAARRLVLKGIVVSDCSVLLSLLIFIAHILFTI